MALNKKQRRYIFDGNKVIKTDPYSAKKNYFERFYEEYSTSDTDPLVDIKHKYEIERIKQKTLRALLFTAVFALAILCAVNMFFKVGDVRVVGSDIYSSDEVIRNSGLIGKNIFFTDSETAKRTLKEKLPLIKDVSVKIQLPDTVVLTLSDNAPEYYITSGDDTYILSGTLDVLSRASGDDVDGMAVLDIDGAEEIRVGECVKFKNEYIYTDVCDALATLRTHPIYGEITAVSVTQNGQVTAEYDGRLTLMLGDGEGFETKLSLAKAYADALDDDAYGIIDAQTVVYGSYLPAENGSEH